VCRFEPKDGVVAGSVFDDSDVAGIALDDRFLRVGSLGSLGA